MGAGDGSYWHCLSATHTDKQPQFGEHSNIVTQTGQLKIGNKETILICVALGSKTLWTTPSQVCPCNNQRVSNSMSYV